MKLILNCDIEGLGDLGDVVDVKSGYARNYLLPTKKGLHFNQHNLNQMEVKKVKHQKKVELIKLSAIDQKTKFEDIEITFTMKSGKNDTLFGSVGVADIVKELNKLGIEIESKKLKLATPIKKLGEYNVQVKLFKDVMAELKVKVISENATEEKDTETEEVKEVVKEVVEEKKEVVEESKEAVEEVVEEEKEVVEESKEVVEEAKEETEEEKKTEE